MRGVTVSPGGVSAPKRSRPLLWSGASLIAGSLIAPIAASSAEAQVMMTARAMPCGVLQGAVLQHQSELIRTGEYTYDRYFTYCQKNQVASPARLSARDNPQCFVGYTCREGEDHGQVR